MFHLALLFAQDAARFERAQDLYTWSLTAVGVGLLLIGAGFLFSRPKGGEKDVSPGVTRSIGGIVSLVGLCLIIYAWLFS